MRLVKTPPSQEIITTAERVLSASLGGTIHLGEREDLQGGSRTWVYRFRLLDGPRNAPAHVIVKQVKSTENAPYHPGSATLNGITALVRPQHLGEPTDSFPDTISTEEMCDVATTPRTEITGLQVLGHEPTNRFLGLENI